MKDLYVGGTLRHFVVQQQTKKNESTSANINTDRVLSMKIWLANHFPKRKIKMVLEHTEIGLFLN